MVVVELVHICYSRRLTYHTRVAIRVFVPYDGVDIRVCTYWKDFIPNFFQWKQNLCLHHFFVKMEIFYEDMMIQGIDAKIRILKNIQNNMVRGVMGYGMGYEMWWDTGCDGIRDVMGYVWCYKDRLRDMKSWAKRPVWITYRKILFWSHCFVNFMRFWWLYLGFSKKILVQQQHPVFIYR